MSKLILVLFLAGTAVFAIYLFSIWNPYFEFGTPIVMPSPSPLHSGSSFLLIDHLEFVDGGDAPDTIYATVKFMNQETVITKATINGQTQSISDRQTNATSRTTILTFKLPSGTLIPSKSYKLVLFTDSPNTSYSERYIFYHMYHPNTTGSVEEGLITSFGFAFGERSQTQILDEMVVTVQNTGDLPITATGGFLNGNAAMKVTQGASIEKGSTGKVTLYFPHYAVWDLVMGTSLIERK